MGVRPRRSVLGGAFVCPTWYLCRGVGAAVRLDAPHLPSSNFGSSGGPVWPTHQNVASIYCPSADRARRGLGPADASERLGRDGPLGGFEEG